MWPRSTARRQYGTGVDVDTVVEAALARSAAMAAAARTVRRSSQQPGELWWDPFDSRWRQDPVPLYTRLLAEAPVHRSPLGFWVVAGHRDCLSILRDRRVSSALRTTGASEPPPRLVADMEPFLFRDPPDHTRLRGLVQQAFTPKMVARLRPSIQAHAESLVAACLDRGTVDLVADLAYPLPVRAIADLLGVPAGDQDRFASWSHALARGLDPEFLLPADAVEQRVRATAAFVEYFGDLIEQRRRRPGPDLLSLLVGMSADGAELSRGELLGTCILLLVAGHETTVNLIAGAIVALQDHPDAVAQWRSSPELGRTAVEELLRLVSPVQVDARLATEPIAVGEATVQPGEAMILLLGAANRDPAVFDAPGQLDLHRSPNPHLGFGFGMHHCLGAPLARMETEVVLHTLLLRSEVSLTDEVPVYKEQIVLRGPTALPARLQAR